MHELQILRQLMNLNLECYLLGIISVDTSPPNAIVSEDESLIVMLPPNTIFP